jgi:hypothetical protein
VLGFASHPTARDNSLVIGRIVAMMALWGDAGGDRSTQVDERLDASASCVALMLETQVPRQQAGKLVPI